MTMGADKQSRIPGGGFLAGIGRGGAAVRFVFAAIWVLVANILAGWMTPGIPYPYQDLVYRSVLLVLLLVGFWGLGRAMDGQEHPMRSMGLMRREGFRQEWALGVAVGWALMMALVLPMMLGGTLYPTFWWTGRALALTGLNLITLAIAALAEEVAFRGYAFQRLKDSVGPTAATILLAIIFGAVHLSNPHGGMGAVFVTMLAGVLLSIAYLRTKSLWLAWGLHFGWNASMGVVFGLPVSGLDFSTVVQTRPLSPVWLTGGLYGPEASRLAPFVVIGGIVLLVRVTRDLAWKYGMEPIVPGGFPMDVPPPAQHAAMEEQAKAPALVQILPTTPQGNPVPRRPAE